eukprot:NODE_2999_length_1070_cov_26.023506_g2751_i0.p1 GENE.NODE_2999_length_1070_cov_26.023506_g2751_i0~~NODE_2999_length_1070_cov_26.023506_g2751_i0.p1  ORF type:complete len:197 (+),score=53.87 NODE_2999_length_1070_cov_26.023506_g2751_i0:219-809(+)
MAHYYTQGFPDDYVNPRGIPRVEFVTDPAEFLKKKDTTAEDILPSMRENYSKYKLMDYKLSQNKATLKEKIPEIKSTIEMLTYLAEKTESDGQMDVHFGIADTVFANAVIKKKPEHVGLWLGANVMVEYTVAEAIELLNHNLASATQNLERTIEDLAFLRDQLTVSEVNIARVFNWDVKERRKEKEAKGASTGAAK